MYEDSRNSGSAHWWVLGMLWVGLLIVALAPVFQKTRPSHQPEHWLLRVTTVSGVVVNEVQGEGCSVGGYRARVWVGPGNTYDNAIYEVLPVSNLMLSCTKLK